MFPMKEYVTELRKHFVTWAHVLDLFPDSGPWNLSSVQGHSSHLCGVKVWQPPFRVDSSMGRQVFAFIYITNVDFH